MTGCNDSSSLRATVQLMAAYRMRHMGRAGTELEVN
jgi:hypothetical protein